METEVPKWSTDKKTARNAKPKAVQQGSALKAGSTSKPTGRAATKAAGKSKPTKDNAKKPPGIAGGAKKSAVYLTSSDEEDDFVGSSVTPKKKLKAEEPSMDKPNNKQKQSQQSSSKQADPPSSESPPDVSQSSRDNFWGISHSSKDAKMKPDTKRGAISFDGFRSKEKIGPGLSPDGTNKDAHSETASMEAKKIVDGTGDEKASEDDEAGNAATPVRKAVSKESLVASSSKAAGTPSTRGANM
ncbi:hypothetical protein AAVH_11665 [Aphelenchoides avenae]|nr:hypothetical protein AAVH_11665 [Aphelenchus avenae]